MQKYYIHKTNNDNVRITTAFRLTQHKSQVHTYARIFKRTLNSTLCLATKRVDKT